LIVPRKAIGEYRFTSNYKAKKNRLNNNKIDNRLIKKAVVRFNYVAKMPLELRVELIPKKGDAINKR
jgi:hypothetical protein